MLELLKNEAGLTTTQNGAVTNRSTFDACLDLFFTAGAMRYSTEAEIADAVLRAYDEDTAVAMKIIFYARDVRGGLGERRFFRAAIKALAEHHPEAVIRNIPYFSEYGRFDDLCVLLDTPCENKAAVRLESVLLSDLAAMEAGGQVSLLAKWLPSVNASSKQTRAQALCLAKHFGMTAADYRRTLSALRKYTDIIENRLREKDYTFDYAKQPSRAGMKYRKAFIRNDEERYTAYLNAVNEGRAKINTSALFPYDIVRSCLKAHLSDEERLSLDTAWRNLPVFGENSGNAIAVIDGSGSMTCGGNGQVRPIDAALSLGIYFAEHNRGAFADHFITFSETPQLVEIKGHDITAKVCWCERYNEVANTDLEAVFKLILNTAVKNKLPESELPETIYIISDMEFDYCVEEGNNDTMFRSMKKMYERRGYRLPNIVFWNVNSYGCNFPVTKSETGAALVSGFSPGLFDMVIKNDISPVKLMTDVIFSERYEAIA